MKRTLHTDISASVDARLEAAIEQANYRLTINNQKENARLKLKSDLSYGTSGGTFQISPELISFVHTLIESGQTQAILLDVANNPILIEDLAEFKRSIIARYYESMNEMFVEFSRLKRARVTAAVVK